MPTIRTFDAGDSGLQPREGAANAYQNLARTQVVSASEAGSAIGGGVRNLGSSIQDVYDQVETQSELSKGGALGAVTFNNLDLAWNTLLKGSDINDDAVAGTFREDTLEPELEKFVAGFHTEKGTAWALSQAQQFRNHFYDKTTGDMQSRAAARVKTNLDTTVNAWASAASDPGSLDFALAQANKSVQELIDNSPFLTGEASDQLRTSLLQQAHETIVGAGLKNMAQKNPDQFIADLDAGKFAKYLGDAAPGVIASMRDYAQAKKNADTLDAKALVTAQDKANKEAADAAVVDLFKSALQPDGTLAVPKDAYNRLMLDVAVMPGAASDPTLISSTASALRAIQNDAESGTPIRDIPEVYADLWHRAFLSPNDPAALSLAEVMKARADRKIGDKTFSLLKEAVSDGVRDPEQVNDERYLSAFFSGYKSSITSTNGLGVLDTGGDQRYYQFQVDMRQAFKAGKAAGHSSSELLDPNSQFYIGGKAGANVVRYMWKLKFDGSSSGGLSDLAAAPIAPILPPSAAPGEDLSTFLTGVYGEPGEGKGSALPPGFVPTTPVTDRLPGESADAYLTRTAAEYRAAHAK